MGFWNSTHLLATCRIIRPITYNAAMSRTRRNWQRLWNAAVVVSLAMMVGVGMLWEVSHCRTLTLSHQYYPGQSGPDDARTSGAHYDPHILIVESGVLFFQRQYPPPPAIYYASETSHVWRFETEIGRNTSKTRLAVELLGNPFAGITLLDQEHEVALDHLVITFPGEPTIRTYRRQILGVPLWYLLAVTSILPAFWLYSWCRGRSRRAFRSDGRRVTSQDDPRHGYCRKCWYSLEGLQNRACPECGKAFDPDDPRSFRSMPRRKYLMRRRAIVAVGVCLLAMVTSFWIFVRADRIRSIVKELRDDGGRVMVEIPSNPEFLKSWGIELPTWLLETFPLVRSITIKSADDADMNTVTRLPGLLELELREQSSVTDEGMTYLRRVPRLERLFVVSDHISDEGVRHASGCTRLVELRLFSERITDASISCLAGLSSLETLGIENSQVTGARLNELPDTIRALHFHASQINDEGALNLSRFAQLDVLVLDRTRITDSTMEIVKDLPNLKVLSLRATQVTDHGLAMLEGLRGLDTVMLKDSRVTAPAVARFESKLPQTQVIGEGLIWDAIEQKWRNRVRGTPLY